MKILTIRKARYNKALKIFYLTLPPRIAVKEGDELVIAHKSEYEELTAVHAIKNVYDNISAQQSQQQLQLQNSSQQEQQKPIPEKKLSYEIKKVNDIPFWIVKDNPEEVLTPTVPQDLELTATEIKELYSNLSTLTSSPRPLHSKEFTKQRILSTLTEIQRNNLAPQTLTCKDPLSFTYSSTLMIHPSKNVVGLWYTCPVCNRDHKEFITLQQSYPILFDMNSESEHDTESAYAYFTNLYNKKFTIIPDCDTGKIITIQITSQTSIDTQDDQPTSLYARLQEHNPPIWFHTQE